jgi:hypothetical protein
MQDIELALRFVAHYTLDTERADEENLDEFLNETVEKRSIHWDDEKWAEIERAFYRALSAAQNVFGRYAFRKYYGSSYRSPINRGLFESETVALARLKDEEVETLVARSGIVLEKFAKVSLEDDVFQRALLYATGRGSSSNQRLDIIEHVFREVLDD